MSPAAPHPRLAPCAGRLAAVAAGLLAAAALHAGAPDDGSWPVAPGGGDNTRYSPLAQIDRDNVAQLVPVFEQPTGVTRGHEAAPIVAGGRLFVVTPWPNLVLAYDVSAGVPKPLWRFEPHPAPAAQGTACCDVVNRGAAHADGRVYFNTLDNQTIALDAATGRELWRRKLGDIAKGETMTMAPLVAKGKVIVGNAGGEMGVRGWIAALDGASGRTVWQFFNTGPDAEVGIGPRYKPFYAGDQGRDLGVSTWPPEAWKTGGGNVWGFVAYDAGLDLLYHGTANPGPWNPEQRPGDNKWTSGVFARRPDTGEAAWFYPWSPHDLHDYDGAAGAALGRGHHAGSAAQPVAGTARQARRRSARPARRAGLAGGEQRRFAGHPGPALAGVRHAQLPLGRQRLRLHRLDADGPAHRAPADRCLGHAGAHRARLHRPLRGQALRRRERERALLVLRGVELAAAVRRALPRAAGVAVRRVWPALLVAPSLVLAVQGLGYALTPIACARQAGAWLHAVPALALAAVLAMTLAAWRAAAAAEHGAAESARSQGRFVAQAALGVGALSALVVLALWWPIWQLSPCLA